MQSWPSYIPIYTIPNKYVQWANTNNADKDAYGRLLRQAKEAAERARRGEVPKKRSSGRRQHDEGEEEDSGEEGEDYDEEDYDDEEESDEEGYSPASTPLPGHVPGRIRLLLQ